VGNAVLKRTLATSDTSSWLPPMWHFLTGDQGILSFPGVGINWLLIPTGVLTTQKSPVFKRFGLSLCVECTDSLYCVCRMLDFFTDAQRLATPMTASVMSYHAGLRNSLWPHSHFPKMRVEEKAVHSV
jgi:hypothetical protein